MDKYQLDTLSEFHLHNQDNKIYALIAHLVSILETKSGANVIEAAQNISNILGEAESMRILQLICQKSHIDYVGLIKTTRSYAANTVTARLLLHLALLPTSYVSEKLQIDQYLAERLLSELHKNFTIDDPIFWLQNLLSQTERARLHYDNAKTDQLHGLEAVQQPIDTAEERRVKKRRLHLNLKPPGAT